MNLKQMTNRDFTKLDERLGYYVENDLVPSVIGLVAQNDEIRYCNKYGWSDKSKRTEIEFNFIFNLASMIKPILSVALLQQYEKGKFDLDDPISNYLPEFSNMEVLVSYNGDKEGNLTTRPAEDEITIHHLATHTSGLSYGFFPNIPINEYYAKVFGLQGKNRPLAMIEQFGSFPPLPQFCKKLASLPLAFDPGQFWKYSFSLDILSCLVEKLSEMDLESYFKTNIFDKLDMDDTGYYVPEDDWHRVAKIYTSEDGKLRPMENLNNKYKSKPEFRSGGGGLFGTIDNYFRFCKMLLNQGQYKGKRILSEESTDLMTKNLLPGGKSYLDMLYLKPQNDDLIKRNQGYGFGLGVLVKTDPNTSPKGIGTYQWGGAFGTTFWIDPENDIISILMTQYCPSDSNWQQAIDSEEYENLVYECMNK